MGKMNIKDNPYYFGVYANMARHNVFMILNDIARKLNIEEIKDEKAEQFMEAPVMKLLKGNKIDQQRIVELLYEHFPFLEAMNKTLNLMKFDGGKFHGFFSMLFLNLGRIRNFCSHAHHNSYKLDTWSYRHWNGKYKKNEHIKKSVFDLADMIFDDSLSIAKERFKWNDDTILPFRRKVNDAFDVPVENKNFIYQFKLNDNDFTDIGLAFFISLFLDKEYIAKFLKNIEGFDENAIELTKIYRVRMPQHRLKSDNSENSLLLDMLNELQRCPMELFVRLREDDPTNRQDKKRFTTDCIDLEDNSEPKLTRNENRFRYFALRYLEYMGAINKLDIKIDLGKYVFHSYQKGFINNQEYIRRWEKHIYLFGKLKDVEQNYTKILNEAEIDPILKTEENPFVINSEWKHGQLIDPAAIKETTPAPYLVANSPHYDFSQNTIALKINENNNSKILFKQRKTPPIIDLPNNRQPDLVLATDELPGMLFYEHLANKYDVVAKVQDIVLNYKETIDRLLTDVSNGTVKPLVFSKILNQYREQKIIELPGISKKKFIANYEERKGALATMLKEKGYKLEAYDIYLEPHHIPDRIVRYLMGVETISPKERAIAILEKLHVETETKLKEAGFKILRDNAGNAVKYEDGGLRVSKFKIFDANKAEIRGGKGKRKKQRKEHIVAGERGTFIAEDLMLFTNFEKPNDGPNSAEYQMLQAEIALYEGDHVYLDQLFTRCKVDTHPFLRSIKLEKCNSLLDFYKQYLIKRYLYIDTLKKSNEEKAFSFLNVKKSINDADTLSTAVKTIMTHPINLPRGLFKDAAIKLLTLYGSENMKKLIVDKTKLDKKHSHENGEFKKLNLNIIFLLNEYFKLEKEDSSQEFYNWERNYRTVDEWFDEREKAQMKKSIPLLYKTPKEIEGLSKLIKESKRDYKRYDEHLKKIEVTANGKEEVKDDRKFYKVLSDRVLENEKLLRFYATCDKMLFLMCENILTKVDANLKESLPESFKLHDILPGNGQSVLSRQLVYSLYKNGKKISDSIKIKDYGNFRRFMKDRRLESLLDYYKNIPEGGLSRRDLKLELDAYEEERLKFFETIYNFELKLKDVLKDFINEEKTASNYVEHQFLLKHFEIEEGEKLSEKIKLFKEKRKVDKYVKLLENKNNIIMSMIRNKFSHNQYPTYNEEIEAVIKEMKSLMKDERNLIKRITDFALGKYNFYSAQLIN